MMGESPFEVRMVERFAGQVSMAPHVRRLYGYDATGVSGVPDAVLFPRSVTDLQDAIAIARQARLPVVARGSGTGLSAGAVPEHGGLVVTFEHMRAIAEVDRLEKTVWVEPGVINARLDERLAPLRLFYPPDPASHRISSIGGNLAENSGGPHAVKYGVTGFHVRQLEIVDARGAGGTLVAGELQPSSDLVSLVVGSEGTLALIARAQLGLQQRPERVATMLVSFASMERATDFVSALLADGLVPACLEFMDRNTISLIEAWGVARYSEGAQAVLLLDVDGSPEQVEQQADQIRRLAAAGGALEVTIAEDEARREALWLGRRGAYAALARAHPRTLIQDVTVPRSRLTAMISAVEEIANRYGLQIAAVGHAGDGNLHPDFPYHPADPEMTERVHAANREVLEACVALDGSITGEHGVGSDKIASLAVMYGPAELGLMAAVKRALDGDGMLNPGKAVPLVPRGDEVEPASLPAEVAAVRDAVLSARADRSPLRMDFDLPRGLTVNEADLVIEVGAGETLAACASALVGSRLGLPVSALREQGVARALLANDYGADHLHAGLFRQTLLAATYVTGAGEVVRMGRPVVKNVAGYDLFRLLIGSRGTLAVPLRFIFRLVPRRAPHWVACEIPADQLPRILAGPHPRALFALPSGNALRIYADSTMEMPGWRPEGDAPAVLHDRARSLQDSRFLLDLAVPVAQLPVILSLLPIVPRIILPAAGRVLVEIDRDEAVSLIARLEGRISGPVRAVYGPTWEPLLPLDPLAARWESSLAQVFDPDRVLTDWWTEI
jgi:D-lactate dehydrogenase (cytochrome)/glycolate oxidase